MFYVVVKSILRFILWNNIIPMNNKIIITTMHTPNPPPRIAELKELQLELNSSVSG